MFLFKANKDLVYSPKTVGGVFCVIVKNYVICDWTWLPNYNVLKFSDIVNIEVCSFINNCFNSTIKWGEIDHLCSLTSSVARSFDMKYILMKLYMLCFCQLACASGKWTLKICALNLKTQNP